MSGATVEYECCVCEQEFQVPASVLEARRVPEWCGLSICKHCERTSRNGMELQDYPRLLRNLQTLRIKVVIDENGRIPAPEIGRRKLPGETRKTQAPPPHGDNVIPIRNRAA